MRILFLSNNLSGGGAERVLVNLANQMAENGQDITLRVLANTGENRKNLSDKVKYEYIFKIIAIFNYSCTWFWYLWWF